MSFLKVLSTVFIFTILSGCASTAKTNLLDTPVLEKDTSLVVLYYVPEYKINYTEEGFLHEDRKGSEFSGVWDLERDMSPYLSNYFNENGFNAVEVSNFIDSSEVKKYIMSPQKSKENEEIKNKILADLKEKGEVLLVEVYITDVEASTNLVSQSGLYGWLNFKVTDVKTKE
ncbi:hypothetical protein [Pseudoalteromonas sp. McH1-42]|nr:hypothetical protein [Pseudoalteromonas sp. McH1-42]MCG7562467.1 hypothetical protein [Pseudoalteromonas sp. McH1-42]